MARYFLRRVSIEGFRGVNNKGNPLVLDFDPTKVVSVFGANGSGKSSIFEALEFAINGGVRRLSQLQKAERPEEYYINKFHKGPAYITLDFVADDSSSHVSITVQRTAGGQRKVTGTVPDPEGFLRSIQAETLLINYRTFEDFILDTPLNRGRRFARLLGLEAISTMRANLAALCDNRNLKNDLNVGVLEARLRAAMDARGRAIHTALSQLSDVVKHEFTTDSFNLSQVAESCLRALNNDPVLRPLIAGKNLSSIDYDKCLEVLREADRTGDRTKLAELQARKSRLAIPLDVENLAKKVEHIERMVTERNRLIEKTKGTAYQALYKATQQLLDESGQVDDCPLCERPWEHPSGLDLRGFIQHELANYRDIQDIDARIRTEWRELTRDPSVTKLSREIAEFGPREEQVAAPTLEDIVAAEPTEATLKAFRDMSLALESRRIALLSTIEHEISVLEASIPQSIVASIRAITAAKNLTETLREYVRATKDEATVSKELKIIDKWQAFIKTLATEFAQAEAQLVRSTIALLERDIRQLYRAILPGAPITPKLSRSSDTEQLHLILEQFYGLTDAHAVPLLSESYRNSLGLAVLLAASCRRPYGGRFLVLDDVTSSFDAGHQAFLLDAIYQHVSIPNNPAGLQVIVLSHDGTLKKYFNSAVSQGRAWKHYQLKGTPPSGMVTTQAIPVDQLRQDVMGPLTEGDVDSARKAVRFYLEAALLQIIEQCHVRISIDKVDNLMPREMMDAIKQEIDLHSKANELVLEPAKAKEITDTIIPFLMGNAWAHFWTDSTSSVDPFTVKSVVEHIDRLMDAFKYDCTCQGKQPIRRFYTSLKGTKQPKCKCK